MTLRNCSQCWFSSPTSAGTRLPLSSILIDSLWKKLNNNAAYFSSLHLSILQWEVCFCSEPSPGTTKRDNFLSDPKFLSATQNLCGINHHSFAIVHQLPTDETYITYITYMIKEAVFGWSQTVNKIVLASHPEPLADHSCQIRRKQIIPRNRK